MCHLIITIIKVQFISLAEKIKLWYTSTIDVSNQTSIVMTTNAFFLVKLVHSQFVLMLNIFQPSRAHAS